MSPAAVLLAILAPLQAAAPAPPVRAEAKEWMVNASPSPAGATPTALDLQLTARGDYHVNLDYPAAFVPSPEATVKFQGTRIPLRPASTAPCQVDARAVCWASFALPYTPPSAGGARVAGVFAFSVCSAERCLIEKVPISITVGGPAARD